MSSEKAYAFRNRIDIVHFPHMRNKAIKPNFDEIEIDENWVIDCSGDISDGSAAADLQDYLQTCMDISLPIRKDGMKVIHIKDIPSDKGFDLDINTESVIISGNTRRGVHYLEDIMNFRESPFLKTGHVRRDPVFTPRMVHSGWAQDTYPDSHLNAIAHAGFDAILLFVAGVNKTTHGYLDFNDLIRRSAKYGLDVYFYSYLNSYKHPDDPDAAEFFDQNFGSVFKNAPGAKGLILVGESCAFPSKDPRSGTVSGDGCRPSPGFFPADDYPEWLEAVKNAVLKYSPNADIVFWTYNWGNFPKDERLKLIEKLPYDVSVEVTFEMFEQIQYPNHTMKVPDYTITFPGPGQYFTSEAEALHKRGMRLYSMTNTAGATWDCGVLPYIPVPQQWFKRFKGMHEAHEKWGLSGIMESHHYGWFPGPVVECAKWSFWSPQADPEKVLFEIARRDFGPDAAEKAVEAWRIWSDAIASYTPGFDDQCGPLRIGPSYPFIFYPVFYPHAEQNMVFPFPKHAYRGNGILNTLYKPEHVYGHTNIGRRIHEDIKIISDVVSEWGRGVAVMDEALALVPEAKREKAEREAGIGKFFWHTLRTMLGIKRWWLLNKQLEVEYDFSKANCIMDELEKIVEEESENVRETVPLVEADSRLGWEPTMEYTTDHEHLKWKLEQLERLTKWTFPHYRKTICKFT